MERLTKEFTGSSLNECFKAIAEDNIEEYYELVSPIKKYIDNSSKAEYEKLVNEIVESLFDSDTLWNEISSIVEDAFRRRNLDPWEM